MKKILINNCYGGYSLSDEYIEHLTNINVIDEYARDNQKVVEEAIKFGLSKASGMCAKLCIREIPENVHYSIGEYDGMEHIDDTWVYVTIDELKNGLSQEKLDLVQKAQSIRIQS